MNKKASHKEDTPGSSAKDDATVSGLSDENGIVIDPMDADEIEPTDRWWDEDESSEREKVRNRRLEGGLSPRDKETSPVDHEEVSSNEKETESSPVIEENAPVEATGADREIASEGGDNSPKQTEPESKAPEEESYTSLLKPASVTSEMDPSRIGVSRETFPAFIAPVAKTPPADAPVVKKSEPDSNPNASEALPDTSIEFEDVEGTRGVVAADEIEESSETSPPVLKAGTKDLSELFDESETESESKGDSESTDKVEKNVDAVIEAEEKTEATDGKKESDDDAFEGLDALLGPKDESVSDMSDTQPKKKAGCWTIFATLFVIATLLLLVLLGIGAGIAWSRMGQFGDDATAVVAKKLEEKGIYLDFGESRYQISRGLVFDEVSVFNDPEKSEPVIKVSGLGVNVDLLGLAKGGGELSGAEISLEDSRLALFEDGVLFSEIAGIDGEIAATEESVDVERLTAMVGGMRLNLSGLVRITKKEESADDVSVTPVTDGEAPPEGLSLDFTAFRRIQPFLAFKAIGESPPVLTVNFTMDSGQPDTASLEGNLNGREVNWNGVDLTSVAVNFVVMPETGELSFPSVQIGYGSGLIAGDLSIDPVTNTLNIKHLQSTSDIIALLKSYKLSFAEKLASIRFVDPPTIQVSGAVPLGDFTQAELQIRYEHREGVAWRNGERELVISDIRGLFNLARGSLETNDAAAEIFEGAVVLNGATRLTNEASPFNGLIEITGMSLEEASAYFGKESVGMTGNISLNFRGVGYADVAKIRGGGSLKIEDATLPSFPVLGPVQSLIGDIVPAFGASGKGSLTGAYIVESGSLITNDLTVERGGAMVVTAGEVKLDSSEVTFTSKAMLEPSLAAATGLTEKAIVMEGSGPLTSPNIRITEFPIEFAAEGLAGVLGTSTESLSSLKATLESSENPAEVISGKIEEATGIKIDPAITDLFNSVLGTDEPAAVPVATPAEN